MQRLNHWIGICCKRRLSTTTLKCSARLMAKSKFEYVKKFESPDQCLPNCWIVVRIDGKGFHKFSDLHDFVKPNDDRSLELMNRSAKQVMCEFKEIILAYGQSDEYSFIFSKNTKCYNRRASKLMTTIASLFGSSFVYHWSEHFPNTHLKYPPAFDARVILYPSNQNLRDYLSWRQADCHINNLYNTVFWKLVHGGMTNRQAQERLKGTTSGDKNEIMYSEFSTNYNTLPELYRKGTILLREKTVEGPETTVSAHLEDVTQVQSSDSSRGQGHQSKKSKQTESGSKCRQDIVDLHCDIIGQAFWKDRPHLLGEA